VGGTGFKCLYLLSRQGARGDSRYDREKGTTPHLFALLFFSPVFWESLALHRHRYRIVAVVGTKRYNVSLIEHDEIEANWRYEAARPDPIWFTLPMVFIVAVPVPSGLTE
jgi:hypothetical protein